MNLKNNGNLKRPIGRPPLVQGQVTISRGVRLLSADWRYVQKLARDRGLRGVSAGVRELVRFHRLFHPEEA